ncbi:MAG: hypothetical protein HFF23_05885 [Oscillospiraceae bacterium]|nr:hypothetical protein [Oscillospiraceae bacterium]
MTKQTYHSGEDPAAMEQLSTRRLEELLLQDFHAPDNGRRDMSGLYHAAQELASREPSPNFETDRAWRSFQENYLPFAECASQDSVYDDGGTPSSDAAPGRRPLFRSRRWLRVAVAAAVLAAALLSLSLVAAASGFDLWRRLAQWTDEVIQLTPAQTGQADMDDIRLPEESKEYATLQEALSDCGLARSVAPRQIPDGFQLVELVVDTLSTNSLIFHAAYQRDEDVLTQFIRIHLPREDGGTDSYAHFQKDEGDPIPYEAGGVIHLLSTNAGRAVAVWANGPAECAISGDITIEELQQIIDSIY